MLGIANGVDAMWGWTVGLGHGFGCLAAFVYFAWRALDASRALARANALEKQPGKAPTSASSTVTLRGRVETEDGRPAMEVRIEQTGHEYKVKHGYRHKWKEVARTTSVRPFAIRLEDGTAIQVRAPEDAILVDDIETQPKGFGRRRRVARLLPGASVAVSGSLTEEPMMGAGEGYRDGAKGWVLRLPSRAILSAHHLSESSARWQQFFGLWALLALLSFGCLQTVAWDLFYDLALDGEVHEVRVTNLSTYVTHGRHGSSHHYVVAARDGEDRALSNEVTQATYLSLSEGDVIPWQVVPERSSRNQIGATPQANWVHLLVLAVIATFTVIGFTVHRRMTTAWWEHETLVEDFPGRLA